MSFYLRGYKLDIAGNVAVCKIDLTFHCVSEGQTIQLTAFSADATMPETNVCFTVK
jgi:hypothetical protein